MGNAAGTEVLADRLKAFLTYLRPKLLFGEAELDRLAQLRRLSDVRLRQFAVGKARITAADLGRFLADGKSGARFDVLAVEAGLFPAASLTVPLTPLGLEMGLVVEACLALQVIGPEKMLAHLREFGEKNEAPAPPPEAPAVRGPKPLPEAVAKILGKVKDLWSIPSNTARIMDRLTDSQTPIESICTDLERDPALAAQCLRVVNSAAYGVKTPIASVKRAVITLGYMTLRQIVSISSLVSKLGRPHEDVEFDLKSFWGHSLWVAHAAALVSKATRFGEPDEHFSAGLVHDIGKLVVYQYLRAPLRLILAEVRKGVPFEGAEEQILGVNHAVIGACVCEQWSFAPMVVEAVRRHLTPLSVLEDLELPREAWVVAALCAISKKYTSAEETEKWCGFLHLPPDRLAEVRTEATRLSLGSLKDVFVYA